jgi:uncharacterized protein (TIGR02996 family)
MPETAWPVADRDLQGLLQAAVDAPDDTTSRLALGDCLEERGDPRAALVRLGPALAATPRREGPHPEVPGDVRREGRAWPRTDEGGWPRLPRPLPPGARRYSGRRSTWRGVGCLGRLLGAAVLREVLAMPDEAEARTALLPLVARWELYACGLIDARARDLGGRVTGPADLPALTGAPLSPLLCRAAWPCRSSLFGAYVTVAQRLLGYSCRALKAPAAPKPEDVARWLRRRMKRRAALYGRFLDLARAFERLAPWQEARAVSEARGR